jgi:MOSC domain-containing protein YiiM
VNHGLIGDAHAGLNTIREVSLLAVESITKFNQKGYSFKPGDFAENITTEGVELTKLPVGSRLRIGKQVTMEITQIGKKCHSKCAIYKEVGRCIMPKEGIFARVVDGGEIKPGDVIDSHCMNNELSRLKDQLCALESQFAETQSKSEANADYRNELIWLSQDINRLMSRIKKLEGSS